MFDCPKSIHQSKNIIHLNPRNNLCKDQPDIHLRVSLQIQNTKYKYNHFDIGCLGKRARDADEEGGEDEKRSQVDRDNGLEEEV